MAKSTKETQTLTPKDVGTITVVPGAPSQAPDLTQLGTGPQNEAASLFLKEAKGHREAPSKIALIAINHKDGGFILPSGECVPEVSGYPILYFHTRKFYKKPPQAGQMGQPPDCWSADLVVPHNDSIEKQNPTCAGCPNNEWGTGRDGRSKACAMPTWIFLLNPAFGNPPIGVVVAPSSSLRALVGTRFQSGYFAQAAARHGVYEIVWTTFKLEQHGGQVTYCTIDPVMGDAAPVEQVRQIAAIRNACLQAMEAFKGQPEMAAAETE